MASFGSFLDMLGTGIEVAGTAKSAYDLFTTDPYTPTAPSATTPSGVLSTAEQFRSMFPEYADLPTLPDMPYMPATLPGETFGEEMAKKALTSSEAALKATLDPASPEFKALASSEKQLARQAYSRSLRDAMTMDRRAKSMGRPGIFGEERGSEQIARGFMEAGQRAELEAQTGARNLLAGISGQYGTLAGQAGEVGGLEREREEALSRDLQTRISQARSDITTRTGVGQESQMRKEDQRRADIVASINAAMGIGPKMDVAQQQYGQAVAEAGARETELGATQVDALGDLLKQIKAAFSTEETKQIPQKPIPVTDPYAFVG